MSQIQQKQIVDCGCTGCSFWLRLEAERADRSYIKPAEVKKELNPRRRSAGTLQDKRDAIMFQAGRYAMGARDKAATKGQSDMEALLGI
jgi:hypothetical protein